MDSPEYNLPTRIHAEEDPAMLRPDARAKAEENRYRDHTLDDDDDNYAIRKALKDHCAKNAWVIFWFISGFIMVLGIAILGLVGNYLCAIWGETSKVESLLSHLFTHSLALVAGLLLKAVFGMKKES